MDKDNPVCIFSYPVLTGQTIFLPYHNNLSLFFFYVRLHDKLTNKNNFPNFGYKYYFHLLLFFQEYFLPIPYSNNCPRHALNLRRLLVY